jgi:hypothetical protein
VPAPAGDRQEARPLDQPVPPAPQGEAEERFWFDRRRTAVAGAAQLVGARYLFQIAAMRLHGRETLVWGEKRVPDQAPPLNATWLDSVRDDNPFLDLRPRAPDELMLPKYRDGYQEYLAYCQAVVLADQLPAEAFAKSAADNSDLEFSHLYRESKRYRGKVIHMAGRLKRVTKEDAPREAERHGVKAIYQGFVFLDRPGPPVVVIFPRLPEGLKVGDYAKPPRVAFDGYFFKRYRYPSEEKDRAGNRKVVTTLLFIAPTLHVRQAPAPAGAVSSPLPAPVLYGVIGFVVLTLGLLVGVHFWYRRSDQKIRSRLLKLQAERFEEGLMAGAARDGAAGEASPPPTDFAVEPEGREKNGLPPGAADGPHGH